MLVLLPPSETKRDGGTEGSRLDLAALSFPELTAARSATLSALRNLSRNLTISTGALGLGPSQRFEIDRNRQVASSPTMPALDRYTGVLYDGIDAPTLDAAARSWASEHVIVGSALFGLIGAADAIPAYRLSHNSRLPGLSLKKHWRPVLGPVLAAQPGVILDLRSESYAQLGPAPVRDDTAYLRVVTESATGQKKALTHFNKKGKGVFVRDLAIAGVDHPTLDSLLAWASDRGIRLQRGAPGELELFV
jgi:cytoplasmic iron level regulating protein YaaA (DUF328/UPF0246 family)